MRRSISAVAAGADPDDDDPPVDGQAAQVVRQVGRAHQLEDDVERAVVGEAVGRQDLGAEGRDRLAQRRVAHRGGDPRAGGHPELHRGGAHAARRAVHQEALAHRQAALGEEGVVGGGEDLGEAAGLVPGELPCGHRHGGALVDDGQLGLAGRRPGST